MGFGEICEVVMKDNRTRNIPRSYIIQVIGIVAEKNLLKEKDDVSVSSTKDSMG